MLAAQGPRKSLAHRTLGQTFLLRVRVRDRVRVRVRRLRVRVRVGGEQILSANSSQTVKNFKKLKTQDESR